MNTEQKLYFMMGAIYQMAKDAKDEGLFADLSIEQIMGLYIDNATNGLGGSDDLRRRIKRVVRID